MIWGKKPIFCFQVDLTAFQAVLKADIGMRETEICENLQKEMTRLMLDMDRLRAENMVLKEDIEHYHKYEALKVLKPLLLYWFDIQNYVLDSKINIFETFDDCFYWNNSTKAYRFWEILSKYHGFSPYLPNFYNLVSWFPIFFDSGPFELIAKAYRLVGYYFAFNSTVDSIYTYLCNHSLVLVTPYTEY